MALVRAPRKHGARTPKHVFGVRQPMLARERSALALGGAGGVPPSPGCAQPPGCVVMAPWRCGSMAPARQSAGVAGGWRPYATAVFGVRQPGWRASAARSQVGEHGAGHGGVGTTPVSHCARTADTAGAWLPHSTWRRGSTAPARRRRSFGVRQPCWRATRRGQSCRGAQAQNRIELPTRGRPGARAGAAGAWLPHSKAWARHAPRGSRVGERRHKTESSLPRGAHRRPYPGA